MLTSGSDIGMEHFAGPILLGIKYVHSALLSWGREVKDHDHDTFTVVAHATRRLVNAVTWVREQVPQTVAAFKSSLAITVFVANSDFELIFPKDKNWTKAIRLQQVTLPDATEQLDSCLQMWELVKRFIDKDPDTSVVKAREAKEKIKILKRQISVQIPPSGAAQKRGRSGERGETPSPPPPPPQTAITPEEIMAKLTISQEQRAQHYTRYDPRIDLVPRHGLAASPISVSSVNLATLFDKSWLDDHIIDSYMALICHEGNRLFDKGGLQAGSPKWHAWSVQWPGISEAIVSWPPPAYPEAKVEDVGHHFFPRHGREHWTLFHLWKSGNEWEVQFYSSKHGYGDQIEEHWPIIASALMATSSWQPGAIIPGKPKVQPIQGNDCDCGVLLLCTARWMVETWPLNTLRAKDCPQLRERMIVELEKWRLH